MNKKASLDRDAFLFCVSYSGNLTIAAEFVGTTRAHITKLIDEDASFRRAVEAAKLEAFERLHHQAVQRALYGVQVPHFYQGKIVGYHRKHSDSLVRYLLMGECGSRSAASDKGGIGTGVDIDEVRKKLKSLLSEPMPPKPKE